MKNPSYCVVALIVALTAGSAFVSAQNVDEMIKKAEGDLRRSNSSIVSGRPQDAYPVLVELNKTIASIQKLQRDHPKLKNLIATFTGQKEKVEKKLGKTIAIAFEVETQTESHSEKASGGGSSSSEKLPYDARYPMQQFTSMASSFENYYDGFANEDADGQARTIKRLHEKIEGMQSNLQAAREAASQKGVNSHPDFDEAQKTIESATQRLTLLDETFQKQQSIRVEAGKRTSADADSIRAWYSQLRSSIFDRAGGTVVYYNDPSEVEDLLARIEAFEKNDLDHVKKRLSEFAARYGDTEDAIRQSIGEWQAANSFVMIREGIANVAKTRSVMARDLLSRYESNFGDLASKSEFHKVAYLQDLKKFLETASRFAPDDGDVAKALKGHDGRAHAALKDFYAEVDKRTWPPHSAGAPKNAVDLAQAALSWFKNDLGWGRRGENADARDKETRRPLAVSVKGPWSVQQTDILGNPVMYGLPVLIAVEVPSEKALNLVRVYDVTMRTVEKAGVKMTPPFNSVTVGSSYYIRPSAIP